MVVGPTIVDALLVLLHGDLNGESIALEVRLW